MKYLVNLHVEIEADNRGEAEELAAALVELLEALEAVNEAGWSVIDEAYPKR
jgi:hypothetical protein